jgi:hypothetical protein
MFATNSNTITTAIETMPQPTDPVTSLSVCERRGCRLRLLLRGRRGCAE